MNTYRIIKKTVLIIRCLILVSFLVIVVGCDGLTSFHVTKCSLGIPKDWPDDWVKPLYKVVVDIRFNRAVDPTSFKAPGTVNINIKGLSSGNIAASVAGSFKYPYLGRAIFISDNTLCDLINPGAGENIEYTITLVGTGAEVITDSNGEALDGDADNNPGGNYTKVIKVIG